jgi:N-methylhydantoinase B
VVRNLADEALDFVPRSCGRIEHPPLGLAGGRRGSGGAMTIDGEPIDVRRAHRVEPGQVVTIAIPGGGGYGDPRERSPDAIAADLANGHITPATATHYRSP